MSSSFVFLESSVTALTRCLALCALGGVGCGQDSVLLQVGPQVELGPGSASAALSADAAVLAAAGMGVLGGLPPAIRAARMHPVRALRA